MEDPIRRPLTMTALALFVAGAAMAGCSAGTHAQAASTAGAPAATGDNGTWRYFARSSGIRLYGVNGVPATEQAPPGPGQYVVSTGIDYQGDHTRHVTTSAGTDHVVCVTGTASPSGPNAECYAEVDLGGSLLLSDHQSERVTADNNTITMALTGGTGQYQGVHGTLRIATTGPSGDADVVISVSGKASGPTPRVPPPTLAAVTHTFGYYSADTTNGLYSPQGHLVTDPRAPMSVGDYIVSTGIAYEGDHAHHAGTPAGTDHLLCVVTATAGAGSAAAGQCFVQLALGRSMVVADHQDVRLVGRNLYVDLNLTGGTGQYRGAHGTLRLTPVAGSSSTDMEISAAQ